MADEGVTFHYQELVANLRSAMRLEERWHDGKQDSIQDELAQLPRRRLRLPGARRQAEIVGTIKWAQNAIAKDIRDDQRLAQAMGNLHAQYLTVELLLNISHQLQQLVDRER